MITKKDVLHVAKLSKLEFNEDEIDAFVENMDSIVGYVNTLSQIDTSGLEEELTAVNLDDLRQDEVQPSLPQESAILNAPKKRNGGFSVPQVVE
ncbi:MAG: Asp-tRNA(Asn)/Glu-tRNA(Gln) amidotransferase subunit GatC [Clostridia bacterium]|jgi:aspartyl-tRNA(Asn)/glutamyl-tRNA(Gln) amidotransferase subunit C|nr:Asp-tRNA(Asn)/Glu-tRNA(Gln) amidotransferase subunit GatC [Clostridia bacterium]